MNDQQIQTIKCAYADLVGAYQAWQSLDIHAHDWKAHLLSIEEMERDFTFLEPVVEKKNETGMMIECDCANKYPINWGLYLALNHNGKPVRNSDGTLALFETKEEAILNSSGTQTPIPLARASLEIQNEMRRLHKKIFAKHFAEQHDTTQTSRSSFTIQDNVTHD
jgi:hypothetical protein